MLETNFKLWQHGETGRWCWKTESPGAGWTEVPWMYEDELPADMPQADYDWWFENSLVDGVRIGPRIEIRKKMYEDTSR